MDVTAVKASPILGRRVRSYGDCDAKMDSVMKPNELPKYDMSVNTTGCCPKFNPADGTGKSCAFGTSPF
jgi:hypothetical protein